MTKRFGTEILKLNNAYVNYRNKRLNEIGLTSSQTEVLREILTNPGITINELKNNLNLSQSTISGIVKRLEKKNIIFKIIDESDTRKSSISPSKFALDLETKLQIIADETNKKIFKNMSKKEIEIFENLIELAIFNLNNK